MNRERFIRCRRDDWRQFELLTARMQVRGGSDLRSRDVADLARLYRSICYDLSLVQSREWGSRLEQYLNDLVAHGHNCLYRSPGVSLRSAASTFAREFPLLLRQQRVFLALAAGLFGLPLLVCMIVGFYRPDLAELVVGHQQLAETGREFTGAVFSRTDDTFAGQRTQMAGFYVRNNVGLAFRAYALGVFFGVGTVFTLLSNGILIGMTAGYIFYLGSPAATNFLGFVAPHSAFELTAIVFSGAAGLMLGTSTLIPGHQGRIQALQSSGRTSLALVVGAAVLLTVAAAIEAFVSPLPMPVEIRCGIGLFFWGALAVFLFRAVSDSGETNMHAPDADL